MKKNMSEIIKTAIGKVRCDDVSLEKYFSVMGRTACSQTEMKKYSESVDKRYIAVIAFTLVMAVISAVISFSQISTVEDIKRSDAYGEDKSVLLEVEAEYRGHSVKEPVKLDIAAEEMTEDEILVVLNEYGDTLSDVFDCTEDGLLYVSGDVRLPTQDDIYGIDIRWESSDPVLFSEEGKINVIALSEKEEKISVSAELSFKGISAVKEFEILVRDDPEAYKDSIKRTVEEVVSEIENNTDGQTIDLPDETEEGIKLIWKTKADFYGGEILCIGAVLFLYVYMSRYKGAEKRAAKYRNDVCSHFPAVPERMLLLIDSGMTSYNALLRISEDLGNKKDDKSNFCREMAEIVKKVEFFNVNLVHEWKDFSARMQSADMLRFCSIVEDNMTKGSDLYEKLQLECRNMRESRRKSVQEKMRLMDSKMMIPMMLMLFSLIIVAAGPAVMEF